MTWLRMDLTAGAKVHIESVSPTLVRALIEWPDGNMDARCDGCVEGALDMLDTACMERRAAKREAAREG